MHDSMSLVHTCSYYTAIYHLYAFDYDTKNKRKGKERKKNTQDRLKSQKLKTKSTKYKKEKSDIEQLGVEHGLALIALQQQRGLPLLD